MSILKKKGCVITKDSINFTKYFPQPGNQGNSYTCLGWALVYSLLTFDKNKNSLLRESLSKLKLENYSHTRNPPVFSPLYNFRSINNYCSGVDPKSMISSIADNGVAYYNPNNNQTSRCSFSTLGDRVENNIYKKSDFSWEMPLNRDKGFTPTDLINQLACSGPFVLGSNNHAMVCVGYNKNKHIFLLINSQESESRKNYINKSFHDLRDISWIITIKSIEEKIAINDSQKEGVTFVPDSTSSYIVGEPKDSTPKDSLQKKWWLGKPSIPLPWKSKKYYFTKHFEKFCISVLKLSYLGSKAMIGIYDKNRQELIYTFNIEPKDEVEFIIDSTSYKFIYKCKSFSRGVFFYPEINYTIQNK
jgi:hypothetical protein